MNTLKAKQWQNIFHLARRVFGIGRIHEQLIQFQARQKPQSTIGLAVRLGTAITVGFVIFSPAIAAMQETPRAPTREQLQPPEILDQSIETRDSLDSRDTVEYSHCPLAGPDFASVMFTLREVNLRYTGPIDTSHLDKIWLPHVGAKLPIAIICEIRDRLATRLRAQGYLAAVRIPEQTIANGIISFDILAAKLARIQVRGAANISREVLARYLAKLQEKPLFDTKDAERYLLLAREIPGLDARLTLRPSKVAGEVIGEIRLTHVKLLFNSNNQNFGTRSVGRLGRASRVRIHGLTGLGDQTSIAFYSTSDFKEQLLLELGHEFRIGGEGLRIGGRYTRAWTRPDITGLPVRSNTMIANLDVSYPVTLRQNHRLTVSAGLNVIEQDIYLGTTLINRDQLRVISARTDALWIDPDSIANLGGYNSAEPQWIISGFVEARKGLDIFGASDACNLSSNACLTGTQTPLSRLDANPQAFVLRSNILAEWRAAPAIALSTHWRGQWARDPLPAYEEFSAGNFTIGRGYDPGTIVGENGVALSAEIRYHSLIPKNRRRFAFQPFAFFDAAYVWNKSSILVASSAQRLYSVGGGLRVVYGDRGQLNATLAIPLSKGPLQEKRGGVRLLVSLTTQLGLGKR